MRGHHVAHGVVLSLLLAPSSLAQNQAISTQPANQTSITVTVTDRDHHPVIALQPENFTLFEDGRQEPIASVASGDLPACVGVLVDKSGSMRGKHQAIAAAMGDFIRAGNPGNRYFVVLFNDDASLQQDFTGDAMLIERAIAGAEARGGTAFYDAVIATADHLAEAKDCQKRVLVLVSDGVDNESRKNLEFTLLALKEDGNPLVYAIGLPGNSPGLETRSKRALEALTTPSGGAAIYIGDYDFRKAARKIADELRGQYLVTFAAPAKSVNPDIKLIVRSTERKDLLVRTNAASALDPAAKAALAAAEQKALLTACIAGSVVDENNKPAADIQVIAWSLSANNVSQKGTPYPTITTDDHGKFKLPALEPGSYRLYTVNESAGYPNTKESLYRTEPDLPVFAVAHKCVNAAAIRLGPRAAKLKISAVGKFSREPIVDFRLGVRGEHGYTSVDLTTPGQEILVPPNTRLIIGSADRRYFIAERVEVQTGDSGSLREVTLEVQPRRPRSSGGDQPAQPPNP